MNHSIGCVYDHPTMHYFGNGIMGMLLTCPIKCDALCLFEVFKVCMRIRKIGRASCRERV